MLLLLLLLLLRLVLTSLRHHQDMPSYAWQSYGETRGYTDIAKLNASGAPNTTLPDQTTKELRRAYYASVSYTDDNIGRVLAALKENGLEKSTVVMFWGGETRMLLLVLLVLLVLLLIVLVAVVVVVVVVLLLLVLCATADPLPCL